MTETAAIIRQELKAGGAMSFARFMERALYCPDFGYYERQEVPIGRRGDFYTSASVGRLFGGLLAFQFASWLEEAGPGPIQIVESGAHDGTLAGDILKWFRACRPELFDRIEYRLVEPSFRRQEWQRQTLEGFAGRVRWMDGIEAAPQGGIRGVIFSNELVDAFPAHRIAWDAKSECWFEWGVGLSGDQFVWQRLPAGDCDWDAALKSAGFEIPFELKSVLPDGFILEISLAAEAWWRKAAAALRHGRLMTIDYGFEAEQFLSPGRNAGTLRGYHRHQSSGDVLASPGDQDLTAHVNFTQLQKAGEAAGLKTEKLVTQASFLTRIAQTMWSGVETPSPEQVREFQTLTHPEHLGRPFKVLVQSRAG